MPRLEVFLLGAPRVELDGAPIEVDTRKAIALLAYLALGHESHGRDALATLLWPESDQASARASLRRTLATLNKALHGLWLHADREMVGLSPDADFWLDVDQFHSRLSAWQTHGHTAAETCPACLIALTEAAALYRGDFLSGFALNDSPDFEAWQLLQAESLRRELIGALERLARGHAAHNEFDPAIAHTRRWLALDPLDEAAHRQLMQVYAWMGQRSAALRQYQECARLLARELDTSPSEETTALFHHIQQGQIDVRVEAPTLARDVRPAHAGAVALPANLPVPLTSFIGREHEIEEIKRLLSTSRLVTLTGAGGSGKTRLAIRVATDLAGAFKDGAWWVELAALTDPALVPQAVAKVLGVCEAPNQPLSDTLAKVLHSRHLLLALDDCEHLIEACARLAEQLLSGCVNLKILATSREALGLGGERLFQVPTLSLPDPQHVSSPQLLMKVESVRLFVERAVAVKSDFALTHQNAQTVAQVCQRLDGIPLATELAAARIKVLSAEEIVAHLDDRFDLLSAGSRTALPRHQTLRATMDWSYDLLSEPERILFRRLSVFAGGLTLEAAQAVCAGADIQPGQILGLLAHLVDKSLVMVDAPRRGAEATRYRLLETIREYARDKLVGIAEENAVRDRHLEFFVKMAEEVETKLLSAEQVAWYDRLDAELDNLRAAIDWSLESNQVIIALRLAAALTEFWLSRTDDIEWQKRLAQSLSRPEAAAQTAARAKALNAVGFLTWTQNDPTDVRPQLEEALRIGTELGDKRITAVSLRNLGLVANLQGDYLAARSFLEESLATAQELDPIHQSLMGGYTHSHLGDVALNQGDFEQAQALYQASASLLRERGDRNYLAYSLRRLGQLARYRGDYERATALCKESLMLNTEIGDRRGVSACVAGLAAVAVAKERTLQPQLRQAHLRGAAQLFGAVEAQLEAMAARLRPADAIEFERNAAMVRALLDEAAFAAAWAEGRAMTLEQAVDYALATKDVNE